VTVFLLYGNQTRAFDCVENPQWRSFLCMQDPVRRDSPQKVSKKLVRCRVEFEGLWHRRLSRTLSSPLGGGVPLAKLTVAFTASGIKIAMVSGGISS
jgi:hypothetical protein